MAQIISCRILTPVVLGQSKGSLYVACGWQINATAAFSSASHHSTYMPHSTIYLTTKSELSQSQPKAVAVRQNGASLHPPLSDVVIDCDYERL